ncbi:MAG: urocanate hydratase [Marine Group II euryarchaeote MED-G38]|nr:urocanate hydratase [Euryarchaeota archaeon]OUV26103.1 MAG: urocanate hydratase [Euryarchaeota archaeon TMED97]PDH22984.1 MAG: urocanate hydratase [Marine Group II euryarchaeote MED-G38]|tara:strand:- start:53138 stop:55138 length:2001 start_codon:yes stop_codon:yes gene_type:complete
MIFSEEISIGIPHELPEFKKLDLKIDHAPKRPLNLSLKEKRLAIKNSLRYFPKKWHNILAKEFLEELETYGHIYMYRFRPDYDMYARPIQEYPAKSQSAASIMHMIQNNLDPDVAQYPHELVTYGGNGTVFQNWIQYRLVMFYLSKMDDTQTLVIYSGHPMGLFPSDSNSPRVVVTNGMVIPNYSSQEDYDKMNAMGVSQYGQMTAGSYMYIGPQGIVHGTAITILNAARKYLGIKDENGLGGTLFVTSGLGGMSGAQAKAAVITGAVCVIAECNPFAARKRHEQGWLNEIFTDLDQLAIRINNAKRNKEAVSLGYVGNIVDMLEYFIFKGIVPDLGSDQTSLHNPWLGGYMPVDLTYEEGLELLSKDPDKFKLKVKNSLNRHANAINVLSKKGMFFWDYGNAFLLEASRAGAKVIENDSFTYPSYVEDIMGPMCFDYGFGPFRWVCVSGKKSDLDKTDQIALDVLKNLSKKCPKEIKLQYMDNIRWISEADKHNLVVGSKARILYADEIGRTKIAIEFNNAIREGKISGPIVLGRDHHDVSGTDSPYRETANIKDGSMFTADMAVQNFVGDSFRGATWISLHNGGGVGWGEVINGGFGMLIDGSKKSQENIESMISWDVNNGIARRSWARNEGAKFAIKRAMDRNKKLEITVSNLVDEDIIDFLL